METKHHCLDECNRCGEDCNCEVPLFNLDDTVYFGNWMKPGEILYGKIIQFITLANEEIILYHNILHVEIDKTPNPVS